MNRNLPTQVLLNRRQVAARLGTCTETVSRLVRRGELPAVRIGRALRFMPDEVAAFVERRRQGGAR